MRLPLHLQIAPLAMIAACTHYELSTPIAAPATVSAVAERGGALLYFSTVEGATGYDVYGARVPTITPDNFDELSGAFHLPAGRSPIAIPDITADGNPWYFVVTARDGSEVSKPTPFIAVTPLLAGAPVVLPTPVWTESAGNPDEEFGRTLLASDYTGDGITDLVAGAPNDDAGGTDAGQLEVFFGSASGLSNFRDIVATETQPDARYAHAMVTGDFNCDGIDDFAVGGPGLPPNARGTVDYFEGGPLGPRRVQRLHPIAAFTTTNLGFGISLAAGDANDDGCDDLLVGEVGRVGFAPSVHLFEGSTAGLADSPTHSRFAEGNAELTGWGAAVAFADLDGDGFDEAIVGEPLFGAARGRVSIFSGPATIGAAPLLLQSGPADGARTGAFLANGGDLDGDGYEEVLIGDFPASAPARIHVALGGPPGLMLTVSLDIVGAADPPQAPLTAIVFDVDQDGYDDLLVGDSEVPFATSSTAGEVTIRRGGPDGLSDLPEWTIPPPADAIGFGAAIAAGDFDGNRTIDLAIGAPPSNSARGKGYVYGGVPTRGPRVDAGRAKYLGEPFYVDLTDAWFFDAGPGPHTCQWTFGGDVRNPIQDCRPEDVDTSSPFWSESGEFVVRLRVEAPDERYGESVTILHAEIP